MRIRGIRVMLCLGILAAWAAPAHAQAIGSIFGKVTDPSGAVLPGVTVTVAGTGLQQPLVGTTTESGAYQFPSVPLGTYTVTFELASFKKAIRPNVVITTGFNAEVDQKLELGQMTEEVTISAASPLVDTKKTTTGGTFTSDVMEKIPTARDPWQVINMAPGVQAGLNVGGSASGQQVSLATRGTTANVQWNLEGGAITDLSSNSSPTYFNFDSLEQIQVTNGGGDVSVQSSGLSINIVTKSGSNVFKGTAHGTFENSSMESNNVSLSQFNAANIPGSANGFLSGNPIKKITVIDGDYGGPIMKNRLWFWGSLSRQDINDGIANFFDPSLGDFCKQLDAAVRQKNLAGSGLITFDKLNEIQGCLGNDRTLIKDIDWKLNYQINSANKIQWLFTSDNKYRNHRGSNSTTAIESTSQQTSDAPWKFPLPTHQFTHTLIASDKLVFNNQVTYVGGGFFLDYQDVPPLGSCAQTRYNGAIDPSGYPAFANQGCLWNVQSLNNTTTGLTSQSKVASYQTVRHTWEAKSEGTYFKSHFVGGDHSLKFGLGWRKAPILSFSHYSGGAQAIVECVGNSSLAGCGDGTYQPAGSAAGVVARSAVLYRDQLRNNDWWTYYGYIQDGYAAGRWRLNGGVRYDWQQSKYLGGCVPASAIDPTALPSQCESATSSDPLTGKKIQSFGNWAPRVSATYDVFGNGKTSIHASYSYYYDTKITLANALAGIFSQPALTWGPNTSSGLCTGTSCWTDLNLDGHVQLNELSGTPSSSNSRFNSTTGIFAPAGNNVDPSAKIGRTREAVVGGQHELITNLAVGVDFIYRKYDNGTTTYSVGYQPGSGNNLSNLYTGPLTWTDPITGISAPYYVICAGCTRPSGLSTIAMTNPNYQQYYGVDFTVTKRFSNRWQASSALTWQNNPQYYPTYSVNFINPTGQAFQNGFTNTSSSNSARYLYKASGSYVFPWDIAAAANYNLVDGAVRLMSINGPGQVYGGTSGNISYSTLAFQNAGTTRLPATSLLDLSVNKTFKFRGGKESVRVILDCFNVLNANTPANNSGTGTNAYASNNLSLQQSLQLASILPPRIFRIGFGLNF
jgi:carboxypeptidase family protein